MLIFSLLSYMDMDTKFQYIIGKKAEEKFVRAVKIPHLITQK